MKPLVALCGVCLLWAGCTAAHYRKSADQETAAAIAEKGPLVPNMDPQFSIAPRESLALTNLPISTNSVPFLGPEAEKERDAQVVSLEKALEIATIHSRVYQSSKEQLYLTALDLTLSRHAFAPLFSAGGAARAIADTVQTIEFEPDPSNPGQIKPVLSDNLAEEHRISLSGRVGGEWLIRDLGRISAAFSTDFLRFLTGDPRVVTSSQLGATFTRPLLRNAGYKSEEESLIQAERDLLYALREFVRFRKGFSVQVATAYYGVLGNRDAVRNSHLNRQSSLRAAERTRALAREGRTTQADLGRLEQQELSSESAWINAIRAYQRSLDDFKILLGVPVETRLVLLDDDLRALRIEHPELTVAEAIEIALAARLDFANLRDEVQDAERKVKLAADRLKPGLDLVSTVTLNSEEVTRGFALPDPERYRWSAGLDLDLPLERKAERNQYRFALIAQDRAGRALVQRHDEIVLEVRESWRTLEQARRNYEIAELGVKLAERRVEEQNLLAELGRAKAQDQVDAQNDLVKSLDARTQALVGHTIARLEFWNRMGILYIKANGTWKDLNHELTP